MEPRIQYTKASDGVNIAFWTLGEGPPLVHMAMVFSHIQQEWHIPECRSWYERLASRRKLVRFDVRGMGLSDRTDFGSLGEAVEHDLTAVVDRLALDRFILLGPATSAPMAVDYASRHPERVSHLILWSPFARPSDWGRSPAVASMRAMMDKDWTFYTEAAARALLGWSEGEPARRFAELIRQSITPDGVKRAVASLNDYDVTDLVSRVKAPTLVLQRSRAQPGVDVARSIAAEIPDARLVILEGESGAPYLGDADAVLEAIDEFLSEGEEPETEGPSADIVHTILFTDVEGSTALTDRLGDAKAREILREHERMVREALKAHGGAEVKALGDGFMTSFSSATRALECAIAMQRAFAEHNESAEEPILVRVGLNAGEPIAEDEDLFGTAVNLAARITAQGKGGEILASEAVRQIVAGKKFPFSDLGETTLRGFEDRVHIYQVSWRGED
jgi:class 3 adenylate cyclase